MTFVRPTLDKGTGADGAIVVAANNDWKTLWNKQELNCTDFTIDAGVTLTGNTDYKPHILRAKGTATLAGLLQLTGKGFAGGETTANPDKRGKAGYGFQPGRGGETSGAGGHALTAPFTNFLDWLFGAALVQVGGAGGGSGGGTGDGDNGTAGGAGGIGGGALYGVVHRLVLPVGASIVANGTVGTVGGFTTGGDATGGVVCIAADIIELPASGTLITAISNGLGAAGKVMLVYRDSITAGAASRCSPEATIHDLGLVPLVLG